MEGDESNPPSKQEVIDKNNLKPQVKLIAEGFLNHVQEILDEIQSDVNFSELTAAIYDQQKSYLIRNLNKLSHMHMVLVNQHVDLLQEVSTNCQFLIRKEHVFPSDSCYPKLLPGESSNVGGELVSLNYDLQSLGFVDTDLDLDTKTSNSDLETVKANVIELKNQVIRHKHLNFQSFYKYKELEKDLQSYKGTLQASLYAINELNSQRTCLRFELARRTEELRYNQELQMILRNEYEIQSMISNKATEKEWFYSSHTSQLEKRIKLLTRNNDELRQKLMEMERELNREREVKSVGNEEKKET